MSDETAGSFNDGFVQTMYENFLANPDSVSSEWREMFAGGSVAAPPKPAPTTGNGAAVANGAPAAGNGAPATAKPGASPLPEGAQLLRGPAAGLVKNMNESLTVPTATTVRTISVAQLDIQRAKLNTALAVADGTVKKLSYTHLIAWALVIAGREFPVMSHTFESIDGKPYRVASPHVNFGLAVDVEKPDGSRGLVVPVVHGAEAMDAAAFFAAYGELVGLARTGKLSLDQMMGGNLTLTNPGGFGTVASVPRLMAHQGTIIAAGSIAYPVEFQHLPKDRLLSLGVSKVTTLTSTYDHRVIQGAESGAYLRHVDQLLNGDHDFYPDLARDLGIGIGVAAQTASANAPTAPAKVAEAAVNTAVPASMPVAEPGQILVEPGGSAVLSERDTDDASPGFEYVETGPVTTSVAQMASVAAAMALIKAYRTHGHLAADLDPLGHPPLGDSALDPETVELTPEIMATIPASVLRIGVEGETLADALPRLREKYCGTIAYQVEHIADHEQRVWLRHMIESGEHRRSLSTDARRALLTRLTEVETFERFVRRAYLAQKQFSIEGVDMLVPMLDEAIDLAAQNGAHEVVFGMAHRGRLNVLTHIIGRPYEALLREFEAEGRIIAGTALPEGGTGDVKYHQGATGLYNSSMGPVSVTLSNNPSHLEVVNPVVEGRARAEQSLHKGRELHHDPTAAVPVLIHGDAAFPGQGVVAETLNLQGLAGYSTGGTVHIIANNQLGFTTMPKDGRSTPYASDLAKGFDVPIIHVNADDPEACLAAIRLASAFRNRFHKDAMVDLIGYRRHGHNETDEPAYTQPKMYETIKAHTPVRELFAQRLIDAGEIGADDVKALFDARYKAIGKLHEQVLATAERDPSELAEPTGDTIDRSVSEEPETRIDEPWIRSTLQRLLDLPAGFTPHPKLIRQLERRLAMPEQGFDWATGEALAFGSLLRDGVNLRLSGQDSQRGTYSQRQLVLHDVQNDDTYMPIGHLEDATGSIEAYNSPLSELACLGFEYGYSVASPNDLVMWEAQYGDFVNGAQIVIDQYIASGLSKWGVTSRLTMLLPNAHEGNGPEHSYARLDRFLAAAAEGNIRVAYPTSPSQYFHLLRRQALHGQVRPLIVMTPKGLLRAKYATSPLTAFTEGRFEWVLEDPAIIEAPKRREEITRLVLCSGKVYYDIANHADRTAARRTAVARIELLYPFPKKQVASLIASYPNLREVVWAQEEPQNLGSFPYILQRVPQVLPDEIELEYVGRPKRAAPSEGYTSVHLVEQNRIVRAALGVD